MAVLFHQTLKTKTAKWFGGGIGRHEGLKNNYIHNFECSIRNYLKKYDLYEDFKLKYDFHSLTVIQYDINGNKLREFPSLTDAAEFVGLTSTSGIAKCCKGKRRSAGGYVWRYAVLP